ncbi:hypothetical protein [Solirubrobacter soli]|uniref:hypothetical protein n=1 Tax=Solirubrobacter soli TaxID=363832 RepID=UPI000406F474|nr:hypothetical protein [Solirubrobacter soli]
MPVPHLPTALYRMQIALADVPSGPARSDLEHAVAIATFDADGAGDGGPLHDAHFGQVPQVPVGPMFPGLPAGPLTEAMDELQRALIWEADNAEFLDANLNSSVYLRAAGHLDRAAATLALSVDAPA